MSRRWFPHTRFPHWPASSENIREQLGLPKKLGPRPAAPVFIARLADNTGEQHEIWDLPGPARMSHRIHAKIGERMVPVGRLQQLRFP